MKKCLIISIAILSISAFIFAQGPPRGGGGRPPQGPPNGQPRFPQEFPGRPDGERRGRNDDRRPHGNQPEWVKSVDTDNNQKIDRREYDFAANAFFQKHDKNNNGILETNEIRPMSDTEPNRQEIPVFLFLNPKTPNLNKSEFIDTANLRFIEFDLSSDGTLDLEEMKRIHPPEKQPFPKNATAQFIGAEMRFGNKTVKDSPFSAETIREENKRLFDGSIIKNVSNGLIFRDSFGRTRQEQPLEFIGGFPVYGDNNQPKRLVNIYDVVSGKFYSLSVEEKFAFEAQLSNDNPVQQTDPKEGKRESLGTKDIEGVTAEGTRITIEIRSGQIGNDKPIFVVTERWFSTELQMLVYSKHTDPFIGEVVFRLVNIKKGNPPSDLFLVPSDFKINPKDKRQKRDE